MITLRPIRRALVPVDSAAAARVSAPNYDEFQSDDEVRALIRRTPESVLRVTMPHCDPGAEEQAAADSAPARARATVNMRALAGSDSVRVASDLLYIYRINDPARPGVEQIGLGGMARIDEIRTDATPTAPIIRNEGIRERKARGRARLIEATSAFIGTVNCAVPDPSGEFARALEQIASHRAPDHGAPDQRGCRHDIWLVDDPAIRARLIALMGAEPEAYVADGNHRSAAAAMLDREHFLCVFFPLARMSLAPYNRLVRDVGLEDEAVLQALREHFRSRKSPKHINPPEPITSGSMRAAAGTVCVPSAAATTRTTPFNASMRTSCSDNSSTPSSASRTRATAGSTSSGATATWTFCKPAWTAATTAMPSPSPPSLFASSPRYAGRIASCRPSRPGSSPRSEAAW